jgi:hypothetical protein
MGATAGDKSQTRNQIPADAGDKSSTQTKNGAKINLPTDMAVVLLWYLKLKCQKTPCEGKFGNRTSQQKLFFS